MTKNLWNDYAKQWSALGPPLRPSSQDVRVVEEFLDRRYPPDANLTALLMGATPELVSMRWPSDTRLLALDKNQAIIDAIWPGNERIAAAETFCGDWLQMPCATGSQNFVIGDGCFTLFARNDYPALFAEIRRVLTRDGHLAMRCFTRPQTGENPDAVFADLAAGDIGSFHVFKWRLAMALHGDGERGVALNEVWQAWHERGVDAAMLTDKLGWPAATVHAIEHYRGVATRYSFPTADEIAETFAGHFIELSRCFKRYELGDRCPTFFLQAA